MSESEQFILQQSVERLPGAALWSCAKCSHSLNHSTFATSPEIVELIGTRLASGQTVGESGQRFSDTMFSKASGAFSSAGDAAGLVVSAPTAAIDADARETYAARLTSSPAACSAANEPLARIGRPASDSPHSLLPAE